MAEGKGSVIVVDITVPRPKKVRTAVNEPMDKDKENPAAPRETGAAKRKSAGKR